MIKKYLEDNPKNIKSILAKYKKHQKNIAIQRQKKGNSTEERKPPAQKYNTRYSKARVKQLQDAKFQAMGSDNEENESDSFASASQSQVSDNESE